MPHTIHHDDIWQPKKCRKHGSICAMFVREDGTEIHIKTREPRRTRAPKPPPCAGCKKRR